MRATMTTTVVVAVLLIATAEAHAQECTRNHELYRIVPKYRVVLLDGGDIIRVMFADWKDERLSTWKPGHNITFCPDQNKMINTTINSVATLLSEFATTPCNPRIISDAIDRSLEEAWREYTNRPDAEPSVTAAKSDLGWYYEVCTDHQKGADLFEKDDFKNFLTSAESLTRINMTYEDPVNESTYKERAAKYKRWHEALVAAWIAAESKKSWYERVWQRLKE